MAEALAAPAAGVRSGLTTVAAAVAGAVVAVAVAAVAAAAVAAVFEASR